MAESLEKARRRHQRVTVHVFDVDQVIFHQHLTTNLVLGVAEKMPHLYGVFDSLRYIRDRVYSGCMPVSTLHSLALQYVERGFFKGLSRQDVCDIAEPLAAALLVSPESFPLQILEILRIEGELEGNALVMAITGSPEEIVLPYCARLGFNGVISSVYECDERGIYTMNRDLAAAFHKGMIMDEFSKRMSVDWDQSIGMGNSVRDLGMLQRVRYPFAINPDPDLLEQIRDDPRIVYVEDSRERGARLFQADGRRRFHEVSYCEVLPVQVAQHIMHIPGSMPCQGNCRVHKIP